MCVFVCFIIGKLLHTSCVLLANGCCLISQEITGQFQFCMEKSGFFHGFTAWFTVYFESLQTGGATVELNTGPNSE